MITQEQMREWRALSNKGMTSAVGEYTPAEFWAALDEIDRLQRELGECAAGWHSGTKAIAENAVMRDALEAVKTWDIAQALERDTSKVTWFVLPQDVRQKIQSALTPNASVNPVAECDPVSGANEG